MACAVIGLSECACLTLTPDIYVVNNEYATQQTGGGDLPRTHAGALQEGPSMCVFLFLRIIPDYSDSSVRVFTPVSQVVAVVERRVLRQSPKTEAFLL